MVHILLEENATYADATENTLIRWNVEHIDDDVCDSDSRGAYRTTLASFVEDRIFAALAALPTETIQHAPYIPIFVASSSRSGSVQLNVGLPPDLEESETAWLRLLPPISTYDDNKIPLHKIDNVLVLDIFDTGTRGISLVGLPGDTLAVAQSVPSAPMIASPSSRRSHGDGVLHEMHVLSSIPPHPNLIGPPIAYIWRECELGPRVCGFAVRFCPGGCLADIIERGAVELSRRSKWAYHVSSALEHVHHVARTYHGDIKLDNVVIDAEDNAILIDFEQGRANDEAAAPELRAGCRVELLANGKLRYVLPNPEDAPPSSTRHRLYPYEGWKDTPAAIEAAEVHTFGVAFRKVFSETEVAFQDMLKRCTREDPNERPSFEELQLFFGEQLDELQVLWG